MIVSGGALSPIENAGNDGIEIVDRETAHQRHRVFVGAYRCDAAARQIEIDLARAPPRQRSVRCERYSSLWTAMMTSSSSTDPNRPCRYGPATNPASAAQKSGLSAVGIGMMFWLK
jgi:hypothetical protein